MICDILLGHGNETSEGCIRGKAHYAYKWSDSNCKWQMDYICQIPENNAGKSYSKHRKISLMHSKR